MRLLIALLLFTSVSSTLGLILCLIFTRLTTPIAWISLVVAALVTLWSYKKISIDDPEPLQLGLFDKLVVILAGLFCWKHFAWVYFEKGTGAYTLNPSNLGDLPLHITYIENLVRGARFWPDNPIFPFDKLHYPFGMDFFTAFFLKAGLDLSQVLPLTGLIFGAATIYALLKWNRGFGVAAFFFSGGAAGYAFFKTLVLMDYQADLAWKNLALTLFIPQRGFLYAFPAGLLLLWAWRRRYILGKPALPRLLEGWLWGTLPFMHFHTFIFLSLLFVVWVVWSKKYKESTVILLTALPLGTLETLCLTGFFKQASIVWFKPGWMIGNQNPFLFFWTNMGLFAVLGLYSLYLATKDKDPQWRQLLWPAAGLFAVLLFVMTAPWEWDNTKLMVWCYLLFLPVAQHYGIESLKPSMRLVPYLLLFFSGFLSAWQSYFKFDKAVEIFQRAEREQVCQVLGRFEIPTRFATTQTYNHPVALCGHQLVAGYGGHLWSHGIKSGDVERQLKELMEGQEGWRQKARNLGVRYVFWGSREQKDFGFSKRPWENDSVLLIDSEQGRVFDLGE